MKVYVAAALPWPSVSREVRASCPSSLSRPGDMIEVTIPPPAVIPFLEAPVPLTGSSENLAVAGTPAKASQAAGAADQAAAKADAAAAPSSNPPGGSGSAARAKGSPSLSSRGAPTSVASPAGSRVASPVSTLMASDVAPGKTGTYPYKLAADQTLTVSDVLLENRAGDNGTMNIQSGTSPLFDFALADFRDLDYHFVQPLEFSSSHAPEIMVACANTGSAKCTPALSLSGTVTTSAKPKK